MPDLSRPIENKWRNTPSAWKTQGLTLHSHAWRPWSGSVLLKTASKSNCKCVCVHTDGTLAMLRQYPGISAVTLIKAFTKPDLCLGLSSAVHINVFGRLHCYAGVSHQTRFYEQRNKEPWWHVCSRFILMLNFPFTDAVLSDSSFGFLSLSSAFCSVITIPHVTHS